jgi:hypothetical protein
VQVCDCPTAQSSPRAHRNPTGAMCQLSPHSTDPIPVPQLMLRSNCHHAALTQKLL